MNSNIASQFSGLPMKALIGAPLKAATDANAMIANAQTQFLLSTCFKRDKDNDEQLEPIMVNFTLSRSTIDQNGLMSEEPLKMDISIPLMTLIPLNSLALEKLTVAFSMEVKSSREIKNEKATERKRTDKRKNTSDHETETELHGTLAQSNQKADQQIGSAHASYEIMLEAGQLPLPNGITTILELFSKNITPIPTKK
ncbi:DUF2589 domain-containing protein, partial [Vibrio penaeicida]|uniref:DUF2589 domain-containing protein n=1 Tax=Vibrio penaeicida TaxID=104609 RepID=A0AAV5NS41_9VIBR